MDISQILKIIAAISTIIVGLVSLIRPRSVQGFTGLEAHGGRGITEIRAILGAFFVGLGIMSFVYNSSQTYGMLGFTYLIIAGVRFISMFLDGSVERSNIISVISEVILGVFLVL
jgi:hypothetical protein